MSSKVESEVAVIPNHVGAGVITRPAGRSPARSLHAKSIHANLFLNLFAACRRVFGRLVSNNARNKDDPSENAFGDLRR